MDKNHLAKIRWHCRRGMLELDILLEKFFDQEYLHLGQDEQNVFERLIECHDQELYKWLIRKELPQNIELATMVKKICCLDLEFVCIKSLL